MPGETVKLPPGMRAIAFDRFGGPDVLALTDLPEPPAGPDTVVVRTVATSVNPVDGLVREGHLQGFFPHSFPIVPGWDVAGIVERVGPAVTEFAAGDRVFGYVRRDDVQHGTYAALVPAPVRTLALAPTSIDLTHAAGIPLAGLTALQAIRAVDVRAGETALVNGASGGVGTFAVQIARSLGARVLGTASASSEELVRSLGAEPVAYGDGLVDGVHGAAADGVDAFLDFHGAALAQAPQVVKDPSRVVSVIDPGTVKSLGGKYVFVRPSAEDLAELARLVDAGEMRVVVDRVLPVEQAAAAQRLSQEGHLHGKLILTVAPE